MMVNKKNHTIIFRIDDRLNDFLDDMAGQMSIKGKSEIDKSEAVRRILNWFLMSVLLKEIDVKKLKTLPERYLKYLERLGVKVDSQRLHKKG
jgi:hypothetical protein